MILKNINRFTIELYLPSVTFGNHTITTKDLRPMILKDINRFTIGLYLKQITIILYLKETTIGLQ